MKSEPGSLDGNELGLLAELENEVETGDYLEQDKRSASSWSNVLVPQEEREQIRSRRGSLAPSVEARLEKLREAEEEAALSAAAQQRRAQMSIRSRRRRDHRALGESIKSALIDSKVERFVASVPRLLPPPLGRYRVRDLRPIGGSSLRRAALLRNTQPGTAPPLRVVTWNVERGYRMAAVIASLRRELPDVVLLSEIDIGCDRSQMLDVGAEIASALGLCLIFATEKIKVNDESFYATQQQQQQQQQHQNRNHHSILASSSSHGLAANEQSSWTGFLLSRNPKKEPSEDETAKPRRHDDHTLSEQEGEDIFKIKEDSQLEDKAQAKPTLFTSLRTALSGSRHSSRQAVVDDDDGLMMTQVTPASTESENDLSILEDDADAFDGVEGVAVLTRFDADEIETIYLPDASKKNDPRKQRLALRVGCSINQDTSIDVIAVHLDAFAGRSSRVKQFNPVLETWRSARERRRALIVGGDLNTHNSGLALLHPGMTGDDYFLSKLWRGQRLEPFQNLSEAEWWAERVFGKTSLVDPFEKSASHKHNPNIRLGGLKLWSGKLDWLLYDQHFFFCLDKHSSKADVASDHPYLRIDVTLKPTADIIAALDAFTCTPPNQLEGSDDSPSASIGLEIPASPPLDNDHYIPPHSLSGGMVSDFRSARRSAQSDDSSSAQDDRRRPRRSASLPPPSPLRATKTTTKPKSPSAAVPSSFSASVSS